MSFKMVVFDWDGTLLDSTGMIARGVRHACVSLGLADPGDQVASYVIGLRLDEALRHAAPHAQASQISELVEAYRAYYLTQDRDLCLFAEVHPMLKRLNELGVLCTVATGKGRQGLNRAMSHTETAVYFAGSRCADECHSKPHPQMLLELMDEFVIDPTEVLMVGDTTHDLKMAQAAGVHAVAVYSGAHSVALLNEVPHLRAFRSVNELFPWLVSTIEQGGDVS